MNFSYEGAELSKIIKSYQNDGYQYSIEYLDGSSAIYTSYNDNEKQNIKSTMIEQAKERDKKFEECNLEKVSNFNILASIVACFGLSISEINESTLLKLVSLFLLGFNVGQVNANRKKMKELKKYKLFLEMLEQIGEKELNLPKYTKQYEFENLYAKPLTIESLDQFSLGDIKRVYKVYKSEQNSKR